VGSKLLAADHDATYSGFRSRGNLTWHVTPDQMVYYTYSQGFRPGAANRKDSTEIAIDVVQTSPGVYVPTAGPDATPTLVKQYSKPYTYPPDSLTNNEIGWKTEWFDRRVQFNGSVYQEIWSNAQIGFFDPQGGLGNLAFSTNGPSYRVRGFEPSIIARVTSGLTFQATAAWNSASQTNSPYLVDNNPASVNYGKPITSIPDPYGPLGSPTAYSPPLKVSARIRYDWSFYDYTAFVQVTGDHQAHMVTATGYVPAFDVPGFSTYGASAGVARGDWAAQAFAQNLTDVNSSVSTSGNQFVLAEVPLRPRVLGIKISYKFGGK
jgi:outer membrane receptor protein involved in Fe transport